MKRRVLWTGVLLGLLALGCLGAILFQRGQARAGALVRITQDGVCLYEIPLEGLEEPVEYRIQAPDGGYNVVTVKEGAVCVSQADCPDQICVHQGWVSVTGAPIVCLPHRLVVEILGGEGEYDRIAG